MTANALQKTVEKEDQYSLAKILGIWAIVSLPMALLTRVVVPALAPHVSMHPGILFWWMMILGMAWQFVVSMWIVYREEGDLRWATIRRRFWLNTPRDPQTGEPRAKLFWWLVPGILLTNRALKEPAPRLEHLASAVLAEFGIEGFPARSAGETE